MARDTPIPDRNSVLPTGEPATGNGGADGATYGGSLLRMQYEEMERRTASRPTRLFENIVVGVGFGAVTLLVTMVLVAVGTTI